MPDDALVRPLLDGSLDLVGDVHGEIEALQSLLDHLGYAGDGAHLAGRWLVFLGDLVDRGPDSPAVVRLVRRLVEAGRAQCVLGNHELNLLLGLRKPGNAWFFGDPAEAMGRPAQEVPQVPADQQVRQEVLDFFGSLPLALERPDLRVVHACWHTDAVERVRDRSDAVQADREFRQAIEEDLRRRPPADDLGWQLALHNRNPVTVLTSGPERRLGRCGRVDGQGRLPWWQEYGRVGPFCVFGHYWRERLPGDEFEHLFDDGRPYAALGGGRAMCLDYSVGKRHRERLDGVRPGAYRTRLAALRWPERLLVFDDGASAAVR
jgi:Calcineurin-like phosphoesterase